MVDNSKFAVLYVRVLYILISIRFSVHILFYLLFENKDIVKQDIENECNQYRVSLKNNFLRLIWAFRFDPYFLTLFYYRIGPSRTSICRLIKKDSSDFMIIGGGRLQNIRLYHPFGTIVNALQIGDNISIRNNTTIGNTHNTQINRPVIGDNVDIGANVSVIGRIRIGNNVTIGAGSVVCKDIPDNAIVVGNPARIIGYNETLGNQ